MSYEYFTYSNLENKKKKKKVFHLSCPISGYINVLIEDLVDFFSLVEHCTLLHTIALIIDIDATKLSIGFI